MPAILLFYLGEQCRFFSDHEVQALVIVSFLLHELWPLCLLRCASRSAAQIGDEVAPVWHGGTVIRIKQCRLN
jgi:hypothetical protein